MNDPQIRWTDRCPLPVLAVSLVLACGSLCMPWNAIAFPVFPCFGTLATGPVGALLCLAVAVLLAAVAWGMYRLRTWAWWTNVAFVILVAISGLITFHRVDYPAVCVELGLIDESQVALLRQMWSGGTMGLTIVGTCVLWLGYLFWVHRYFVAAAAEQRAPTIALGRDGNPPPHDGP